MLRFERCVIENGNYRLSADFTVESGRFLGVIGPSGSGKTTLLEAVAGFLPLASGQMFWRGELLSDLAPGDRPVAMLFQDGNLFPHLTAAQNVGLGLRPKLRLTAQEDQIVAEALTRVDLADLGDRKPAHLSGGQRARVALARLIVQKCALYLLDEPFAALGPALKANMLTLVSELAKENGAAVLMVSHEPNDACQVADEIVLVEANLAHAPVETKALFDNPPKALKAYLGEH